MALSKNDLNRMRPKAVGVAGASAHRSGGDADDDADKDEDESAPPEKTGQRETEIWTIFTKPGGTHVLAAPTSWSRVRITLTTAGPVVVGNKATLDPVVSGRGILVPTNEPLEFALSGGSRLYYAADAVNRISVVVEPVPWMEAISQNVATAAKLLSRLPRFFRR